LVFLVCSPVQRNLVSKVSSIPAGEAPAEPPHTDRGSPGGSPYRRRGGKMSSGSWGVKEVWASPPRFRLDFAARYLIKTSRMRKVLKSPQGPLEIKPQEKSVWVCMCGLSKNQPFCDGSHKKTRDEQEGKIYEYDDEGHRHEIA
jgi:CDGSH-type Zn-finger protein